MPPSGSQPSRKEKTDSRMIPTTYPGRAYPTKTSGRADVVERPAVPQRLGDAQRDGDEVGEDQRDQSEVQGDGNTLHDRGKDRVPVLRRFSEVQHDHLRQPRRVCRDQGLVQAVEGLQAGQLLVAQALCALPGSPGTAARLRLPARVEDVRIDRLLERASGNEARDQEEHHRDPQECRNDQEEPLGEVREHDRDATIDDGRNLRRFWPTPRVPP